MRASRTSLAIGLAATLFGAFATGASGSTFTNSAAITIPNGAPTATDGPASPYPSTIAVSGLPGPIVDVNATLVGLTHTCETDLDILLVGPGGQQTILLSDTGIYTCAATLPPPATITLDDEAAAFYPCDAAPSGSFKPTNDPTDVPMKCGADPDPFPAPAPGPPYPVALSSLDGSSTNGTWSLYVFDQYAEDVGTIGGGWNLDILPAASCAGKPATVGQNVGTPGNDVITGTPGADVLIGLGGNDKISGLGGKDVICGGDGNDKLLGGPGKDLLRGERGRDKLKGQDGKDTCVGGPKPDKSKGCEKVKSI